MTRPLPLTCTARPPELATERLVLRDRVLREWSVWPDLYQYAADGNARFAEQNLNAASIGNSGLNWLGLYARDGALRHSIVAPGQATSERIRLLMGPWYHVSDFDGLHLNALQLLWFDLWLKDDSTAAVSSPARARPSTRTRWCSRSRPGHAGNTRSSIATPARSRPWIRRL